MFAPYTAEGPCPARADGRRLIVIAVASFVRETGGTMGGTQASAWKSRKGLKRIWDTTVGVKPEWKWSRGSWKDLSETDYSLASNSGAQKKADKNGTHTTLGTTPTRMVVTGSLDANLIPPPNSTPLPSLPAAFQPDKESNRSRYRVVNWDKFATINRRMGAQFSFSWSANASNGLTNSSSGIV